jgi:hypothetical protein
MATTESFFTSDDITQFREIYRREFGADISDAEALEAMCQIVDLVRAIYGLD